MRIFDLHCDTITECCNTKQPLEKNSLAVSLERGRNFSEWVQVFAIWMPDEYRGQDAVEYYEKHYHYFLEEFHKNSGRMLWRRKEVSGKMLEAKGICQAILAVEGGSALAGKIENVEKLSKDGVSLITLTWNGDNELGSGVLGSGNGLTAFGKKVVSEMNRVGIIPDVSHLDERGFWQVAELSQCPFIASHSSAKAVCDHPRNLTDEQFLAVKKAGGIVGVNFHRPFLRKNELEKCSIHDIIRHVDHFLSLGGEDCLCLGSDFDGAVMPNGLESCECLENLADEMARQGYGEELIDCIFFQNANRFFREVLG